MEQVIFVDKPSGVSSFGVVARVRRVLSESAGHKVKVGHTGTLDPFATGLMVLLAGKATKRAGEFSGLDKVYEATFKLGETSSTGDPEGEIRAVGVVSPPTVERVEGVLRKFVGEIVQVPPIFSAIKVGGERAYKLARRGKEVKMPERKITVYGIELLGYEWPFLRIRAHVSSGTYIRSLAEDVGKELGVGAYVVELRRVKVGEYDIFEVPLMVVPE